MFDCTQINKLTDDMWNCIDSNCVMPESLAQEIDEKLNELVQIIENQRVELKYLQRLKERRTITW